MYLVSAPGIRLGENQKHFLISQSDHIAVTKKEAGVMEPFYKPFWVSLKVLGDQRVIFESELVRELKKRIEFQKDTVHSRGNFRKRSNSTLSTDMFMLQANEIGESV